MLTDEPRPLGSPENLIFDTLYEGLDGQYTVSMMDINPPPTNIKEASKPNEPAIKSHGKRYDSMVFLCHKSHTEIFFNYIAVGLYEKEIEAQLTRVQGQD